LKKKTKSILDEINNLLPEKDKSNVIESRANHIINSAINLINLIRESYDDELAGELERRFLNSIKGQDANKFNRGIRRVSK
jgi:hypothetical protein